MRLGRQETPGRLVPSPGTLQGGRFKGDDFR